MTMFKGMKASKELPKELITFTCEDPSVDYFVKPEPAKNHIPEWYKDLQPFIDGKNNYRDGNNNTTVKRCMPVFDAMTAGYMLLFPCDVYVGEEPDGQPSFQFPIPYKLVSEHAREQLRTLDVPAEYEHRFFKWANPWIINVPKGWSVLFTQPMHRDDLPFSILPGIVDADDFTLSVQFPFLLRKDFRGLIPAGTPMVQLIPVKRAEWDAEYTSLQGGEREKRLNKHSIYFDNRYKRTVWNRKKYN
jgi:hypothetical protein